MNGENKVIRKMSIHQGDIAIVNFGRPAGRKADELHPALVISNDHIIGSERLINVIPLYRQPSRACRLEDIPLNREECNGLKYIMYVQPLQSKMINCYQIVEVVGSVTDRILLDYILNEVVRTIISP